MAVAVLQAHGGAAAVVVAPQPPERVPGCHEAREPVASRGGAGGGAARVGIRPSAAAAAARPLLASRRRPGRRPRRVAVATAAPEPRARTLRPHTPTPGEARRGAAWPTEARGRAGTAAAEDRTGPGRGLSSIRALCRRAIRPAAAGPAEPSPAASQPPPPPCKAQVYPVGNK
ncbi:atherin-like [Schistocerca cancellata]|uniref:atherin-like n=1 Tax=Schistocerca cancellata TaxID=274614 RepID=UPI002117C43C|nr:atherin-like [Schistocerca cancellata]